MVAFKNRRHYDAMQSAARLTGYYYEMYRPGEIMVRPKKVIGVLNQANVRFVLMGAHGLAGWRKETRSTKDIDVLVTKRDLRKAIVALHQAFPKLEVIDGKIVTRFVDPKTKVALIDVMKPVQRVFQMAFRYSIPVGDSHRIPDLEMAIVSKFAAMISSHRIQEKKMQDGVDFIIMVRANLEDIQLDKLLRLADKAYTGGGAEIRRHVEDIRAGRPITF